jgi:hypothetical protein
MVTYKEGPREKGTIANSDIFHKGEGQGCGGHRTYGRKMEGPGFRYITKPSRFQRANSAQY